MVWAIVALGFFQTVKEKIETLVCHYLKYR
jgi:hypothetical protein